MNRTRKDIFFKGFPFTKYFSFKGFITSVSLGVFAYIQVQTPESTFVTPFMAEEFTQYFPKALPF